MNPHILKLVKCRQKEQMESVRLPVSQAGSRERVREESQLILASTSIALYITQLGVELILGVDEKTATYLAVEPDALMLECES